jgi:hypothetical protein
MERIIVNDSIAERIKRFPPTVYLYNEHGIVLAEFIREGASPKDTVELSQSEIAQTLRDMCVNS